MTKKILVCDDDTGISELLRIIFKENGYQVKLLDNGRGIVKKINEYKPDLMLLDIWMPGLDGKEVVKILKNNEETRNLPIIIISALNEVKQIAKECGADDFLPKPFNIDDLLILVKKYIK